MELWAKVGVTGIDWTAGPSTMPRPTPISEFCQVRISPPLLDQVPAEPRDPRVGLREAPMPFIHPLNISGSYCILNRFRGKCRRIPSSNSREGMLAKTPRGLMVIPSRARARGERARGELIALIYYELRRVASRLMLRERAGRTLPPTAVVHEDVIRLLGEGVFDRAMDRSSYSPRLRGRCGRCSSTTPGGGPPPAAAGAWRRVPLDSVVDYFEGLGPDVVAVHEGGAGPVGCGSTGAQAQVMPLRYFGGMIVAEVGCKRWNVSVATVERDWRLARAWLAGQLREGAV